jgi:HD-GYP domain-containing protein (c-di-GMP phosphodiesterase class II)
MIETPINSEKDNGNISVDIVKEIKEMRAFAEVQIGRFRNLIKIGTALSGEKDHDRLLGMIVEEAKNYTNADGCTLYIKDCESDALKFKVVRNESLNIRMGGVSNEITWPPVPLKTEKGEDNHKNVSAHCAITGKAVNISDVYDADFDFQGTKDFDANTGYRSKSMLLIPMRDHEDQIIGVVQLLNAQDRITGEVVDFPENEVNIITSLASQAAIAMTNMSLMKGLEELLYSIVKMIAAAIDEKSPYTAGHVQNVAQITDKLVQEINSCKSDRFADVNYSTQEMEEIRLAAWLHDVGKITTPEYVVDKATKLETIFDRIELVKYRIELLKKDVEIKVLKQALAKGGEKGVDYSETLLADEMANLQSSMDFLESVNIGGEFLNDESLDKVKELAGFSFEIDGEKHPLLTDDECANLSIRKGTLNGDERAIINNHAQLSVKMLGSLPFPQKFNKIPLFAGMHHEKLDGSGYPAGLAGDEIPLPGRIMAVADVFEALTAADRPYKDGKKLSEAMRIIGFMVKDNHLDADVCNLMVESGLVARYAIANLAERQLDEFDWNGVTYSLSDVWNGADRRDSQKDRRR